MADDVSLEVLNVETVEIQITTDQTTIDLVSENVDLAANTLIEITETGDNVLIEINDENISITATIDDIVSVEIMDGSGLPGPPGAPGTTEHTIAAFTAANALSGRRAVYGVGDGTVDYASQDAPATVEVV